MDKDKVRVIKISKEALFEFIYEKFIERQEDFLDVAPSEVSDWFDIDFENGQFIFCAFNSEDEFGNFLTMPKDIDLQNIMKNLSDTTDSLFSTNQCRYKEFTKEELINMSKF